MNDRSAPSTFCQLFGPRPQCTNRRAGIEADGRERGIFLALGGMGLRPGEARALETSDYRDAGA